MPQPSQPGGRLDLVRPHSPVQPYPVQPVDLQRWDLPEEESDFKRLLEYWKIIRRRKGLAFGLTALGVCTGLLVSLCQTPIFRARMSLEIQRIPEGLPGPQAVRSVDPTADIGTQALVLESNALRQRVAAKLSAKPPAADSRSWSILEHARKFVGLPVPDPRLEYDESIRMASATLSITPVPDSRILEVECESTDPRVAADFVNELAREFILYNQETRWTEYQRAGEWLTRANLDLKKKLEESEAELQNYAQSSGLMVTSETHDVTKDTLAQLQAELSRAKADRIAKQSLYSQTVSSSLESISEVLDDGPIRQYQVRLGDLRQQLAELSSSLTPAHYRVKRIQAQIDEVQSLLAKEQANILKRLKNEYDVAVRRESQLEREYTAQSAIASEQSYRMIKYNILKREVDTSRQLYEMTLQKGKEASIAAALRANGARVLDAAVPPLSRFRPNLLLNAGIGMACGLFFGVVLVLFREHADPSIQVPADLLPHVQTRDLGVIPTAKFDREFRLAAKHQSAIAGDRKGALLGTGRRHPDGVVELVTWTQKPSMMAESFRSTMASILFSFGNGSGPQTILVTSPGPKEGKSTVISNLGIALAEINRRVLIIDGDLRIPRLHGIFHLDNSTGLSNVLREDKPISEYADDALVCKTEIPGLYIVPSGSARANVSSLLYSARMNELLLRFRRDFQIVLIDTAPVVSVPDARILARLADAVVLVFRAGHTTREAARAAARRFEEDGTPVLGSILNYWNPKTMGYGYYGSYGSYKSYAADA